MKKVTDPSYPSLTKYYFSDDEIDSLLTEGTNNKKSDEKEPSFIDINDEFAQIDDFLDSKFTLSNSTASSKSMNSNPYFDIQAEQQQIDELLGMVESTPKISANAKKNVNIKHIIVQIENLLETLRQQL
jgi:hypothetical protein